MRAMSAAASTRLSVFGPIVVSATTLPDVPARRMIDTAESRPPIVQTKVDRSFGLMADRRARSGFAAAARTAFPRSVRVRKSVSRAARSGTTTRTASSDPRTRTPAIVHVPPRRSGSVVSMPASRCGSAVCAASGELGDADRRHEHDDARRVEQPADHRGLDRARRTRRRRARRPSAPASSASGTATTSSASERRRERPEVADREVDDAARAVDQHDADREQPDGRARRRSRRRRPGG